MKNIYMIYKPMSVLFIINSSKIKIKYIISKKKKGKIGHANTYQKKSGNSCDHFTQKDSLPRKIVRNKMGAIW